MLHLRLIILMEIILSLWMDTSETFRFGISYKLKKKEKEENKLNNLITFMYFNCQTFIDIKNLVANYIMENIYC